jgi:hypothetical protein
MQLLERAGLARVADDGVAKDDNVRDVPHGSSIRDRYPRPGGGPQPAADTAGLSCLDLPGGIKPRRAVPPVIFSHPDDLSGANLRGCGSPDVQTGHRESAVGQSRDGLRMLCQLSPGADMFAAHPQAEMGHLQTSMRWPTKADGGLLTQNDAIAGEQFCTDLPLR